MHHSESPAPCKPHVEQAVPSLCLQDVLASALAGNGHGGRSRSAMPSIPRNQLRPPAPHPPPPNRRRRLRRRVPAPCASSRQAPGCQPLVPAAVAVELWSSAVPISLTDLQQVHGADGGACHPPGRRLPHVRAPPATRCSATVIKQDLACMRLSKLAHLNAVQARVLCRPPPPFSAGWLVAGCSLPLPGPPSAHRFKAPAEPPGCPPRSAALPERRCRRCSGCLTPPPAAAPWRRGPTCWCPRSRRRRCRSHTGPRSCKGRWVESH